jgi:glycosidase
MRTGMKTTVFRPSPALLLGIALLAFSGIARAGNTDLSGTWKICLDPRDAGTTAGWQAPGLNDSDWETTRVPGPWSEDYDGVGWYRRTVKADTAMSSAAASGRLKLVFRQVDDESQVFLNGKLAAEHHSWNTPFFVDLGKWLPPPGGELTIAVRVTDHGKHGGILKPVEIVEVLDPADLYRSEWHDRKPESTLRTFGGNVMYSVYVRNFSPEGTFDGLRRRLPELKGMGVGVLWLLPIHEIGAVKRKGVDGSPYAIRDYYSVDPALGTKEDFRSLVRDAHKQGLKVIIDCVLNHMAPDSVAAREHPEWFYRDAQGNPAPEVADWSDVVDWDWANREVWDCCANAMEYWVREFDVDGYRCDVADMVPAEFWKGLRKRLERIKPGKILMLAESTQPQKHLEGFDMTYSEELYATAISVMKGRQPADALKAVCLNAQYGYPRGAVQLLFTENHDKERAIREFGGPEQAKLGAVLVATLPGVPLLYAGTETGAFAPRDETFFKKTPVDFTSDPHGMRAFWSMLLALRAKHPALQTGELKLLDAVPAEQVLAFERFVQAAGESRGDRVLVILNLHGTEACAELKHELLPAGRLTLGPWQWAVFADTR